MLVHRLHVLASQAGIKVAVSLRMTPSANALAPAQETKSTCPYCGVGCGVLIEHQGGVIRGVRGDPDHPANFGRLCTKGTTLHLTAHGAGRVLKPEVRFNRNMPRMAASWNTALDYVTSEFTRIIEAHGPDAVAFYISGQLTTEDYYVFNKLAKGLIGTNNVDTNSRLCMSSAVAGYKQTLGADAPPACYEDIGLADCLFIAGSNTAYAHPILFRRIEDAKAATPDLKIIVVDPRRTDTTSIADLHLAILPGTDIALYNAMLNVMLWENLVDQAWVAAHTDGFDALKIAVRDCTPAWAAQVCGVAEVDIVQAARWFAGGSTPRAWATLSLYCQGLNQSSHGTHNNAALINLHLATAQIGKPGAGPLSLTGQPNAMGGREVGGLANLISAHREMANPTHRAEVARLWGIDDVPAKPGKTAVELFDALKRGEIKAVWIACTNPAQSMPDAHQVRAALDAAQLVVVQEAFSNTDTVPYADVLLPASTWGEKEGTVTNSERRITRVNSAVPPPGRARHDWKIVVDFAHRLARDLKRPQHLFPYETVEEIFNEHRETTRGRDLDITGLSYAKLMAEGPLQWPFFEHSSSGTARLYEDGQFATANQRAQFVLTRHTGTAEATNARYPLALNTGRLRDQWHGMSRTGLAARLYAHVEEPTLSLNPTDLARRNLAVGDLVRVSSARGSFVVRCDATDDLRPGQAFMPMHWGGQTANNLGVNSITSPAFDPFSKQPELKHAAVEVARIDLPHRLVAMKHLPDDFAAQAFVREARAVLAQFDHATLTCTGREHAIVTLNAFHAQAIADPVLAQVDQLFGLDAPTQTMRYVDARRRIEKAARVEGSQVTGVALSGETVAADWLKSMMLEAAGAEAFRPWILAPLSQPPKGSLNRGKVVCNCLNVAASDIEAAARQGLDLADVQAKLQCGTSCGSCLPEVRRIISAARTIPIKLAG